MGHSSHSQLTPHKSAGSNQMPLDLCPTSSSSGAVGSAIVIIGTQAWTSVLDLTLPSLCPLSSQVPSLGSSPSPLLAIGCRLPPDHQDTRKGPVGPTFHHLPAAADPVEPEHRYHTLKTFQALFQPAFPAFQAHLFHTPNSAGAMSGSSHVKEILL